MATFFLFGKYSSQSLDGISKRRTEDAMRVVGELGGEVKAMYALLGEHDLALIVELPGNAEAVRASVLLSTLTGIGFSTAPAVTVEEFDGLMA